MSDNDPTKYYAERAGEYDEIYRKPERQSDIRMLSGLLMDLLGDRRVLEVACGTGYWTRHFGPVTEYTLSTDFNTEMLAIAGRRLGKHSNIELRRADAYALDNVDGEFNAAVGGFWWSHVEKGRVPAFLRALHARLRPGSRVVFFDNLYVEGSSTPIAGTDGSGNSYQDRVLNNGRRYQVIKNFPTGDEFREFIEPHGDSIQFRRFDYFWCGWYEVRA